KSKRRRQPIKSSSKQKQQSAAQLAVKKPAKAKPVQAAAAWQRWLIKSEPESRIEANGEEMKFSLDDLRQQPDGTAVWDGVRNYQARNFLRDSMQPGHLAFFYHSNCKQPGIVGISRIVSRGYPDPTQFEPGRAHFDAASQPSNPRWFAVDVKFELELPRPLPLAELRELHLAHKQSGGPLRNLALCTCPRLSVQPVSDEEWRFLTQLAGVPEKD
ncbi:hypothetical protein BOX15_Mlig033414g1, partial [Macrostomum lignano]